MGAAVADIVVCWHCVDSFVDCFARGFVSAGHGDDDFGWPEDPVAKFVALGQNLDHSAVGMIVARPLHDGFVFIWVEG